MKDEAMRKSVAGFLQSSVPVRFYIGAACTDFMK